MDVFFDYNKKQLIDSGGTQITRPDAFPEISYQSLLSMRFQAYDKSETDGSLTDQSLLHVSTWKVSIDKDYLIATNPMTRTLDANIDSSGSATGLLVIEIDTDTSTFQTAIDGKPSLECICDVLGYNALGQKIEQFTFSVLAINIVDPNTGTPGEPVSNYYDTGEVDSLVAGKADITSTITPVTITDDQENPIILGLASVHRAFNFWGCLSGDGSNYNMFTGYIVHNGTTATFVQQSGLKFPADIAGSGTIDITTYIDTDNVTLDFTLAGVGSNLTFTYGIIQKLPI